MGGPKRRYIDTPPRGIMERVIPSVKQKTRILLAITAFLCCSSHGAVLVSGPVRESTSQLLRRADPGRLLASGSSASATRSSLGRPTCCLRIGWSGCGGPVPKSSSTLDSLAASTSSLPPLAASLQGALDPSASSAIPSWRQKSLRIRYAPYTP